MTDISMLREIRQQPEVLERLWLGVRSALSALARDVEPGRLHLAGCGDTYFAARSACWIARLAWGREVHAWRSMEMRWVAHTLDDRDLVVCASVSGRTRRTIEAARLARSRGARVVALCDNPGSPLTEEADETVLLETSPPESLVRDAYAGYEHQVAQTKTYTALLFAELLALAPDTRGVEALAAVPAVMERSLSLVESTVQNLAPELFEGRTEVAVLGSGPWLPTAQYGAAKWIEFAVPALAQCLEEYNHLQLFVASNETLAILLVPDRPSHERAIELTASWERLGVRSLIVRSLSEPPRHDSVEPSSDRGRSTRTLYLPPASLAVSPFVVALAVQLLALSGAQALDRSVNDWVGGRRTDLIQEISLETIRGSGLWGKVPPVLEEGVDR